MFASVSRKFLVAGFSALSACLLAGSLHAQAATPCTYYVSTTGTDFTTYNPSNPSRGTTVASAFRTPQAAHDYLFNNPTPTNLGKKPINVCVEAGTYYASDFSAAMQTKYSKNPVLAESPNTSASVLNIYLSGGPNAQVTFEADPTNNPYVLFVQTGWNGISIAPYGIYNGNTLTATSVPQYVTVNGLNVQGEGSFIEGNSTLNSWALQRTDNPQPNAFFDGNCVGIVGVAQGTQATNSPWGIPSHITLSNNVITLCGGGGIAANQADYVSVLGNSVDYCSWWSIYGTSGISLFHSIDSDNVTGITKNIVSGNWVTGNYENVPWVSAGAITDGEGIIIDSNLNSAYVGSPAQFSVNVPAYASRTLVANNVVWGNGSSAIEVFESQHVDVEANSTYANVWEQYPPANFEGRAELSLSLIADVTVANNVFESVAPSESGVATTSYPLCATDIIPNPSVSGTGYVWFENNVYYAGSGQTVSFPTSGPSCQSSSTYPQFFYEGVNELWNSWNPGYENTSTSGWPARVDLGVQNSTVATNGCASGGGICLAPSTDILGKPRAYPYASGAYAQRYE